MWQADDTPLDVWVADERGRPARSWLTFVLDDYSRAVAGYALSLRVPSTSRTALAPRQAMLDRSGRPPASPAALRQEIERLRESAAALGNRVEDVVALRGRLTRLEGLVAPEQARSAEAQAETARLSQLLADERHTGDLLRREMRQHPEQLLHLSKQLAEAQAEAASATRC